MDRNEFKRLQKAHVKMLKKDNPQALFDWGVQLENQIREDVRKEYEEYYQQEVGESIDNWVIAIMYTLHFSEKTRFGAKRLKEVMQDIDAVVDEFATGTYTPEEYKEILAKDGILLEAVYKETKEKGEK